MHVDDGPELPAVRGDGPRRDALLRHDRLRHLRPDLRRGSPPGEPHLRDARRPGAPHHPVLRHLRPDGASRGAAGVLRSPELRGRRARPPGPAPSLGVRRRGRGGARLPGQGRAGGGRAGDGRGGVRASLRLGPAGAPPPGAARRRRRGRPGPVGRGPARLGSGPLLRLVRPPPGRPLDGRPRRGAGGYRHRPAIARLLPPRARHAGHGALASGRGAGSGPGGRPIEEAPGAAPLRAAPRRSRRSPRILVGSLHALPLPPPRASVPGAPGRGAPGGPPLDGVARPPLRRASSARRCWSSCWRRASFPSTEARTRGANSRVSRPMFGGTRNRARRSSWAACRTTRPGS
jgi:hypothetical protein